MITIYAEITSVGADQSTQIIEIKRRNIISFSYEIFDRADYKAPSFGLISNDGSLQFSDMFGNVFKTPCEDIVRGTSRIKVFLRNTLAKNEEQIADLSVKKWNYDNRKKICTLSLTDELEEMQNINVPAIEYDVRKTESKNLKYFYEYLRGKTPAKFNVLPFAELDEETQKILEDTFVEKPFLKSDNLWSQWTKLCNACCAYMYWNRQGKTVFKYCGGR